MSDKRYLGNIITPTPTAPTGDAASGVWSLAEALNYRKALDWPTLPQAPVIGTATAGNAFATVPFTAPNLEGGTLIQYTATSNPGSITGTASSSPITVSGLTNDTSYTFSVTATTGAGTGPASAASNSVTPALLERLVFFGGNDVGGTTQNVIEYIDVNSTGNGTDFGDLWTAANGFGGVASDTRGVIGRSTSMRYITFASTGNTTVFGDLNFNTGNMAGAGSNTRGLFVGGSFNTIDYITIASTGNATDFGDLNGVADDTPGALAGTTRTVFGKVGVGEGGGTSILMSFVTTATTGNASTFGDLTASRKQNLEGASSATRGLFAGGYRTYPDTVYYSTIEFITIASEGNSSSFGDLTTGLDAGAFGSGKTRAVFGGGYTGSTRINVMQYVTIATTGNTTDFGDLITAKSGMGSASAVHGGNNT